MLSFEWQALGRPLNSFIAGFKTLHFKKYKSYSQMNEGWGVDERELLMCPVGRYELNLPEQLGSTLQRDCCSVLMAQPGTIYFPQNHKYQIFTIVLLHAIKSGKFLPLRLM